MQGTSDLEKGIPQTDKQGRSSDASDSFHSTDSSSYHKWVGDYDYLAQWIPPFPPFSRRAEADPKPDPGFIGPEDHLPIFAALALALQHALSMIGGIQIIPRLVIGNGPSGMNLDWNGQANVICTMLFLAGISSILRAVKFPTKNGGVIGTGLLLMCGPAITFVPVIESSMKMFYEDGTCDPGTPCIKGFGKLLGTFAVGSVFPLLMAFVPRKIVTSVWPPMVNGVMVTTMAITLLAVAVPRVGGGAGTCFSAAKFIDHLSKDGVSNTTAYELPAKFQGYTECPSDSSPFHHEWGAAPWIGLALFALLFIFFVEVFGPPALRTMQFTVGIVAGTILSAAVGLFDKNSISEAPVFTFPFHYRFPLGFYWPALIPVLISYAMSTAHNIAIVQPASEIAGVSTNESDLDSRVRTHLITDSITSLMASLFMTLPPNPFTDNLGVVMSTRVAHPFVGIVSGIILMLFGTIGKLGGLLSGIPDPVMGGVFIFFFKYVVFVGLDIFKAMEWSNRNQFIVAMSIGIGSAVAFQPDIWSLFIPTSESGFAKGLHACAYILVRSSFAVAAIVAVILNGILPRHRNESK